MDFPTNILELGQMFHSDEACMRHMLKVRWPDGFSCPVCGNTKAYFILSRKAMKCAACAHWTYLTEGTVMEKTKTSLCKWFAGAYLSITVTPGISAVQFQRQLGIPAYECAFQILHKLRAAMVSPDRTLLRGVIEMDETFIGGHRIGPRGRGAEGKALVLGAVERIDSATGSRAGRVRLLRVDDASNETIVGFLQEYVAPGTIVRTDGWKGYPGIVNYGYDHDPHILNDPEQASKVFPHIHRVFGNLKAWIIGTFHGVSPKHMQAYLNEYTFKFNRRKSPWTAFNTVLRLAAHSPGPTYEELYASGTRAGWEHPQ